MSAQDYINQTTMLFAPAGWPDWTGLDDVPTPEQVRELQRKLGIKTDGYPGPATIAACARADWDRQIEDARAEGEGLVVIGPRAHRVMVPTHTFLDDFELGTTRTRPRRRPPHQVLIHYDVTYSAEATHRVLARRKYSTHFCIDGDERGTIWQYHDPATAVTLHGGSSDEGHNMNSGSIGVDLNNPADVRYAPGDERRRGRARGQTTSVIHGHRYQQLKYYPEQIASLAELLQLLEHVFGIPLVCPRDESGQPIHTVIQGAHRFEGVLGHYHATRRKRDPAPLDWNEVTP